MTHLARILLLLSLLPGCSGAPKVEPGDETAEESAASTPSNVVPLHVGGPNGVYNTAFLSVRVCAPGDSSQCVTVPRISLDTAATGLRIFSHALQGLALPQELAADGEEVADCVGWDPAWWGPIRRADVILGGLEATNVPVQVLDATYKTLPKPCGSRAEPGDFSNGTLGISPGIDECGDTGCSWPTWHSYYKCDATTCRAANVAGAHQIKNVLALLPTDNNGIVVSFPSVPREGAVALQGRLILGVGTRGNNQPTASAVVIPTDGFGGFNVSSDGKTYPSGLDTDTGWYNLPFPSATVCSDNAPLLCPKGGLGVPVDVLGPSGDVLDSFRFDVANFDEVAASGHEVFSNIAGNWPRSEELLLGFPFFLGRNVYVGLARASSVLGTGPLMAYEPRK